MNNAEQIGKAMWLARQRAGMSVSELSEKTEITASTIRSYEAGRVLPGLWNLWHIADALGVKLDELVGRTAPRGGGRRVTVQAEVDPELLAKMAEWRVVCTRRG